jgi:hypothetical protein
MKELRALITAGLAALGRHRRLVAILYGVELLAAMLLTLVVGWSFTIVFGARPLFDRAVAGDLAALFLAFDARLSLLIALAGAGVAVALAWAVASFYLGAGLTGALAGRPFGETAAARFGAFARLWLWSLLPFAAAGVVLAVGVGELGDRTEVALGWGEVLGSAIACLAPGVAALALVSCLVDYARALLVADEAPAAGRALVRSVRLVFTRSTPVAHFFLYVALWLAVTAIYALLTWGRPYAGTGGAVLLFVVRQLTLATRFAARVVTTAGQVAYVTDRARRGAP